MWYLRGNAMDYTTIGTAKGPGEGPHEFLFITPDEDGLCKVGEFVFYMLAGLNGQRQILGRIVRRAPVRLFPDSFMASPDVSPAEIAAAVGYLDEEDELFEMTVSVMGHFDPGLNSFINPRVLPRSGSPVYLAPSEMLASVLSRRRLGDRGSAHVGWLLSREQDDVPVVLDVNEFASTHMSIIAGTGSGKSYLAGVTIEELMKPHNKACVLVVDPHGEYETLLDMCNHSAFSDHGYRPRVTIRRPDQVKVRVSSLTLDDIRYLLPSLGERMEWILTEAYQRVRRTEGSAYDGGWTIEDLENQVEAIGDEHEDYSSSVLGLRWRIGRRLKGSTTFDNTQHLDLNALFQPGQCSVLQLNEIDQQDQQVVVATLLRRVLRARMETSKGKNGPSDENYLPYPVFVLLEEAHHFAPASGDGISSGILKQVLSEGRKFGVGIGLISQRPGKLDADVLSQCMTHFIMRIVNPIDQNSVAGAVESVGRDLLQELASLSTGQVIIAGSSLNTPVICQTRTRLTRHGGISVDAVGEWDEYFRDRDQRARDLSVVDNRSRRSDVFRPT